MSLVTRYRYVRFLQSEPRMVGLAPWHLDDRQGAGPSKPPAGAPRMQFRRLGVFRVTQKSRLKCEFGLKTQFLVPSPSTS